MVTTHLSLFKQFGITQQIDDDNKRVAQKYLNGAITSSEVPKEDRDNLNHLQAVYHACMDEQHLHQVASKPLMDIVDEIKRLWRRPGPDSRGIFDPPPVPLPPIFSHLPQPSQPRIPEHTRPLRLTKVLSFLHARAIHVFFEPYVDADWRNDPEKLLLNLHQADLGMPDPSYYEDGRALKVYENVVAKTLNEVYAHATTSYEDQLRMAQTVVQLEKKLAKALASPLE